VAWFAAKKPGQIGADDTGALVAGFIVAAVAAAIVVGWFSSREAAEEAKRRKSEEEWNSPKAVEQRRVEAERWQARKEEREHRRKAAEERAARKKWAFYHRYMGIDELDGMDGRQFETFIKTLFERLGHKNVRETPASGDQGGDLVSLSPDNKQAVVQAKRWKGAVGNSAIQEVLGAMLYYKAEIAFVATSSYFTRAAKDLASKGPTHPSC
jgi:restriction endonuclease Mrr